MKANELRINNIIETGGEQVKVTGIMTDSHGIKVFGITQSGVYFNTWVEHCNRIPLTNNFLLNFGCKSDTIFGKMVKYSISGIDIWHDTDRDTFLVDNIKNKLVYLNFVHNFQNIYYALTGDELTLKETT